MNYFTLFKVPEKFEINKKLLSENFYKLQLKFHPDLFINVSESKKKIVLERSIEINKGYKILKDFVSRAIYLLSLNGFQIKKETLFLQNNNFLIQHFALHEELENLIKNNFNKIKCNEFSCKIEKKIINCKNRIEIEFKKKTYEKIIKIIAELLFFKNIQNNFKKQYKIYLKQMN